MTFRPHNVLMYKQQHEHGLNQWCEFEAGQYACLTNGIWG